jgi:hypothetical protein
MLLLAALAAEFALVSFQYFIVETFCTYCLIILSLVVLLNVLNGLHHALTGAAIFVATLIAFSSLQFEAATDISAPNGINALNKGAYAVLPGDKNKPKLSLFFSSTCPHCEKVIESLEQGATCEVNFNPVSSRSSVGEMQLWIIWTNHVVYNYPKPCSLLALFFLFFTTCERKIGFLLIEVFSKHFNIQIYGHQGTILGGLLL